MCNPLDMYARPAQLSNSCGSVAGSQNCPELQILSKTEVSICLFTWSDSKFWYKKGLFFHEGATNLSKRYPFCTHFLNTNLLSRTYEAQILE